MKSFMNVELDVIMTKQNFQFNSNFNFEGRGGSHEVYIW